MKIRPILWTYHKTKSGEYPIKIRVTNTIDGKTKIDYFPINISVKKNEWDGKAGRVKVDARANGAEINAAISEKFTEIERNYLQSGSAEPGDRNNFYWWFQERIDYTKAKHGTYNYKKLQTVFNKLKDYSPILSVQQVTGQFLKRYEAHLLNAGYHVNYVADQLTRIRIITGTIIRSRSIPKYIDPFEDLKIKTVKTVKERLNEAQIEKLFNLKFKGHPSVRLAINMYMYSFYNGGIRFGDLCRQEWSMIHEGRLRYAMHKSTVEKNIKQHQRVLKMLAKLPKKGKYIFDTGVDWKDEDLSINRRNSFFNKKLKLACKMAKIPEITFHTSRHSITDIAVKKKIHPVAMKDILGHGDLKTTMNYMKSFYSEESDAAMDEIFNSSPVKRKKIS